MVPALALQEDDWVAGRSVFAPFPVDRGQVIVFQVRFDVLLRVCLLVHSSTLQGSQHRDFSICSSAQH